MSNLFRIARKEFESFFATPTAFIFFGAFSTVTLFTFFWVDTFFARNIADVRPLFEWMPLLLIFLVAAITMRMWSEERRAGTLELLLTAPVDPAELVLGKFLACVSLVGVALLLTLPIPLTVAQIGNLDWGPVIGGYVATLSLASAYAAIGLFVSARSDNAIVSLIVTTLLCAGFYLVGSDVLTSLFGNATGEFLKQLGSGARFESITRGVLDLRDLYFYASIVGVFLTLNVLVLEWLRWSGNKSNARHRRVALIATLVAANLLAMNLWLAPIASARIDLTQGNVFSISEATRGYLSRLQEPLLMRGYFSAKTHPLLAPLVPRLRDLLDEYARAGGGNVRVEFIDPLENPELEQEAGEKFGIRPVPFRTASKYEAAVVNSYFNILVKYGDEYEVLGFQDLLDIKVAGENQIDVDLRNPEYDLTRAIRKVFYAYQGAGDLFAQLEEPIRLHAYLSPSDTLPERLGQLRSELETLFQELAADSSGKLLVEIQDPDAEDGSLAKRLAEDYGLSPILFGLFDPKPLWFSLMLESGDRAEAIPLPDEPTRAAFERAIDAALKRFTSGSLRTIALHTPPGLPPQARAMADAPGLDFGWLTELLREEHSVVETDLESGRVPSEADLLILAGPRDLDEVQLFAVDQFLMQGGTVVVASSPFEVDIAGGLSAKPASSGLEAWLEHNGIRIRPEFVLDPQSASFPVPVERRLGGLVIQETQLFDYPYFVDVRESGLARQSGVLGGLDQVTVHWASPLEWVSQAKQQTAASDADAAEKKQASPDADQASRRRIPLLESSPAAWTSASLDLLPRPERFDGFGFPTEPPSGPHLLGAIEEGRFESYFQGKESPLLKRAEDPENASDSSESDDSKEDAAEEDPVLTRVIDKSPDSARLIVFGSDQFLSTQMLQLSSSTLGTDYVNPALLVENAVDWSLEDRGLLELRGRAQFSRTLVPLPRERQILWEYLNYGAAALALGLLWLARARIRSNRRIRHREILRAVEAHA